jgi:predicted transcriptional regulator of viral defense system
MQVNNLTDQIPKSVYFNVEQPATGGGGSLTQGGIDRAFKGKCRVTNNVIKFRDLTIHKINGQNTARLGVTPVRMQDGSEIETTNIERTLIDIAVRPVYSGGISEVANAYRAAAEKVSGNRLATYLKSLNYTYPYHQVIGYYMDKAGNYSDSQMKRIGAIPREFDFYLTYQTKNPVLDEKWRLYTPKGF